MIYVMGMSHTVCLLRAVAAGHALELDEWIHSKATEFTPMATRPGMLPGDVINSLIISDQGWDNIVHVLRHPDGRRELQGHPGYIGLLEQLQPRQQEAMLVSILHGSAHSALSLVQHPQPFDFTLAGHPELPFIDGAQPVAESIVRRQLQPYLMSTIATLALARVALPDIDLVHVFAPPPTESEAEIRRVPEGFRQHLDHYGIAPLSLRLKYYLLSNRMIREGVAELGVQVDFVDAPPQAVAPSGGLKGEYAFGATHGNDAYGALLAAQLNQRYLERH
ncbi:hypothetical protein [Pseudoduganella buxea]|uniref:Uncharacterized protein n=1 Tax=Pseudoduganella buxea TaxID=1949069 RepID=A0A6I3T1D2_9BURK|nr:hypothetical protein [Pseudoduganella buxea]MTV55358.1 hypothetical protein [Pseudoduganella buxea]GGC07622.1 hypothetical protein GCM10011572_31620 [Pseudoduganella buxea]